jgi:hypothetical protein
LQSGPSVMHEPLLYTTSPAKGLPANRSQPIGSRLIDGAFL